jgi:CheW-like domain
MLVGTASFLVVRLGLSYLALPAAGVRGILTQEATDHERAVTEAGIIYQPMDLAERLSVAVDLSGIDIKTVLYSNGRSYGAVRVEQVVGLTDVEWKDCFPLPLQFQRDERCWFGGTMFFQDQLVLILNLSWALRELADAGPAPIRMAKQMVPVTPETIGA